MRRIRKLLVVGCMCAVMTVPAYADVSQSPHTVALVAAQSDYENIAVSQVTDYVNIREAATTDSEIVGKIYNNCAATILETVDGEDGSWYRIQSGSVNGYIKAQYFITGEEAEKLAQSIRREFVTINVESLRLREEPNLESNTLTLLSKDAEYVVIGDEGDFYQVEIDTDLVGYIAKQYSTARVEFDQAVSLEEERQQEAEEAQRKQEAEDAIAALEQVKIEAPGSSSGSAGGSGSSGNADASTGGLIIEANPETANDSYVSGADQAQRQEDTREAASTQAGAPAGAETQAADNSPSGSSSTVSAGPGGAAATTVASSTAVVSATRTAIVAYAKQFLGNPYVYGGTSLVTGADCSGFTQAIFAHFGITTGRSSRDQADNCREISVSAIQPGDLLFYGSDTYINHVAIYIGNGQVIHSSNERTGVIISPYNYRTPAMAGTFLN
ncbi:MAG: NlpC/P60 family protein [Clostridiales bacterium]|nr:NlpC/P60 family protein [Clostridiales bacterium]